MGEVEKLVEFNNREIKFESGKKQYQQVSTLPTIKWKLEFGGLNAERLEIEAFHQRHFGNLKSFYWVDTEGVQQIVRFAQTSLPMIIKREAGVPVAYTCEITFEKVI